MIERAARLVAGLGGAKLENARARAIAERVERGSVDAWIVAHALADALERDGHASGRRGVSTYAMGATIAAVCATIGLRALLAWTAPELESLAYVPLAAWPFALLSIVSTARARRGRVGLSVAAQLLRVRVPVDVALEVGEYVEGLSEGRLAELVAEHARRGLAPSKASEVLVAMLALGGPDSQKRRLAQPVLGFIAASWVVFSFYVIYWMALGEGLRRWG